MTTRRSFLMACALAPFAARRVFCGALEDEWRRVLPPLDLVWPRDHGAHLDTRTEWWYLTGLLATPAGRELGFQLTIFRSGLAPGRPAAGSSALRANHVLAAHFALADVANERLLHAERVRRVGAGLADVSERDLDAHVEGWSVRRVQRENTEQLVIRAADAPLGIALELELEARKPLVLHGKDGYSQKGVEPGNASAYTSWTRLFAEGVARIDGEELRVSGGAWYDHEYGTSQLGEGVVGWDWFSLQLDDGRELMLYVLRREDGQPDAYSGGTLVAADGVSRSLALGDFEIEATSTWTSPRTGGVYPASWRVRVPSAALELELAPLVADAELDTTTSTGVVYWEGPVRVRGSASGQGYAELTGYAGDLAGRF